jgi:hypothetical protein
VAYSSTCMNTVLCNIQYTIDHARRLHSTSNYYTHGTCAVLRSRNFGVGRVPRRACYTTCLSDFWIQAAVCCTTHHNSDRRTAVSQLKQPLGYITAPFNFVLRVYNCGAVRQANKTKKGSGESRAANTASLAGPAHHAETPLPRGRDL